MKKTLTFILSIVAAVGIGGWGMLGAQAATTYTAAQVATHHTAADCWLIISGSVYDVTNFIPIHPGGNAIVPFCGTDATSIFNSIHGSTGTAANDLPAYLIGVLGAAPAPLTAPSSVHGTPAQTSIALSWTGSTGGVSPIMYTIMRNGTSTGTTSSTTFTDTGLTASTTYSYVIKATDSATPTPSSMSSAALSVMTLANVATSTPLTAPTNVHGTPASTSVALSWTGSTGGVSPITYTVMKNGTAIGTTSAMTFNSTGLTASTTYSYVIKATDSATPTSSSMSSAALSVMTLGTTVSGGGENENEMENESGDDGGHNATSTPSTGGTGGHHGDDGGGSTTGTSAGSGSTGRHHNDN